MPSEDNYAAIRHAAWLATDAAYKTAVETFSTKQAYLEDRADDDRPDDFARVEVVVSVAPKVALTLDVETWENNARVLSAEFLRHPHIIDSNVAITASANNRYLLNSEGTRVRQGATGVVLTITAEAQAADGQPLQDRLTRYAEHADALPSQDVLIDEVRSMASRLAGRAAAPVLEDYLGPVIFDDEAAPQLFQTMIARGVAARAETVGGGRRRFAGAQTLDKYLGKRILPREFGVYDDPRSASAGSEYLAGHYTIDDDGVPAERVDLVVDGRLQGLLMSRVPTRDFDASNGHGRSAGGIGGSRASVGCLFIEAEDARSDRELTDALLEAVEDQGLDYGLRVRALDAAGGAGAALRRQFAGGGRRGAGGFGGGGGGGGGGAGLSDPIAIYKVFPDGHEELVRGCEFGSIDVGTLRDIIAAGDTPRVLNAGAAAGGGMSIVAPAVLLEEMALVAIEDERGKLPVVAAPHQRKGTAPSP